MTADGTGDMANDGSSRGTGKVEPFPGSASGSGPGATQSAGGAPPGGGGGRGRGADRAARRTERVAAEHTFHADRKKGIADKFDTQISNTDDSLARAGNAWDHIFGDENRQPRYAAAWLYWPVLVLMALAEVPVNRLSFELFFGESPTIMFIVAALVGAIFMAFAHGVGIVSRQFRYHVEKAGGPWVAIGQLAVMLLFVVVLSYGVAVFRQAYLDFATRPDPSFAELMRTQQFGQAALAAAQTQLKVEGWVFLFINLAIVFVGGLVAYFCHDPHPDFQKTDEEQKKLQRELDGLDKRRARAEAAETLRHANVIRRLST
jgi:hypothetical protein